MPTQKIKPSDFPQAVIKQIELLAQNIVIARKRRKETQAQWAKKLGVSQPTMARIERGDPSVGMASYVMCIWLINPASALADLIAPQYDHISLEREIARVRSRRAPIAPGPRTRGGSEAAKPEKGPDHNSAAMLAPSAGGNPAQTAAGLAALMSKARGKAK